MDIGGVITGIMSETRIAESPAVYIIFGLIYAYFCLVGRPSYW